MITVIIKAIMNSRLLAGYPIRSLSRIEGFTKGFRKLFAQSFPEGIVKELPIGFPDLFFGSFLGRWGDYPLAERLTKQYFFLHLGDD